MLVLRISRRSLSLAPRNASIEICGRGPANPGPCTPDGADRYNPDMGGCCLGLEDCTEDRPFDDPVGGALFLQCAALLLFYQKTRILVDFYQDTASTDSHSRRSLRSLLECSCFAFLVARCARSSKCDDSTEFQPTAQRCLRGVERFGPGQERLDAAQILFQPQEEKRSRFVRLLECRAQGLTLQTAF